MFFFFQAEDGIRDLVRSRGLGDVYKRQGEERTAESLAAAKNHRDDGADREKAGGIFGLEHLSLIHI